MDEKRQFTRLPFMASTSIEYENIVIDATVFDISLKGIHFSLNSPTQLPLKNKISLKIQFNEQLLVISVLLVRATPLGYAGVFEDIEPESFYYLKRLLMLNLGSAELINKEINAFVDKS